MATDGRVGKVQGASLLSGGHIIPVATAARVPLLNTLHFVSEALHCRLVDTPQAILFSSCVVCLAHPLGEDKHAKLADGFNLG
jgi:hypothetical protein